MQRMLHGKVDIYIVEIHDIVRCETTQQIYNYNMCKHICV